MNEKLLGTVKELLQKNPTLGRHRIAVLTNTPEPTVARYIGAARRALGQTAPTGHEHGPRTGPPDSHEPKAVRTSEGMEVEYVGSSKDVRTLEQLIEACKIDLTQWTVAKWVANKWASASTKAPNGRWTQTPLFQVKAWLTPRAGAKDLNAFLVHFLDMAKRHAPRDWGTLAWGPLDGKNLVLEVSIPDPHLAKLAWAPETGHGSYDSKIGIDLFRRAVDHFVAHAMTYRPKEILLPLGNDYFNSDNHLDETTEGTQQDSDGRWQKTFKEGCDLAVESIERLARVSPVRVLLVPGNHDVERSYYLGLYLAAWFRNHRGVTIDCSPGATKYVRYGVNLLGFNHGRDIKGDKLPLLMARERPKDWAECSAHAEWHLGHLHHEIVKENIGVIVRWLPSLCGTDAWHSNKGFRGNRPRATGFLYHLTNGLQTIHYFNA